MKLIMSSLRVSMTGVTVLLLGLVFTLQSGAQAMEVLQDSEAISSANPSLKTVLFEPIPENAVVEVLRPDATDLSETVARRAEEILKERGYTTAEDGEFGLRFVFSGFPETSEKRRNVGVSAFGQGGSETETEVGVSVRMTGSARERKPSAAPVTLRMSLARRGRPPIWAGKATTTLRPGDREGTALSLTNSLLAKIGEDFNSMPSED